MMIISVILHPTTQDLLSHCSHANTRISRNLYLSRNNIEALTVSKQHEDGQIHSSFPAWVFLDGDAVASGGEHFAAPYGDQLTALVSASHVV